MMLTIFYTSPTIESENPTITIRYFDDPSDASSSSAEPKFTKTTLNIEGHDFDIISEVNSSNVSFVFDQDSPTRLLLELAIKSYLISPDFSSVSTDLEKHREFETIGQSYLERAIKYILTARSLQALKLEPRDLNLTSITRVYSERPDTHLHFYCQFLPGEKRLFGLSDNIIIINLLCFPDNESLSTKESATCGVHQALFLDIPGHQINIKLFVSKTIAESIDFKDGSLQDDLMKNTDFLSEVKLQLIDLKPVAYPGNREKFINNIASLLTSYLEPILQESDPALARGFAQ